MKQGRLVYCCVWLGLFPPSGLKIEAAAGAEQQTQSYISGAHLPTACQCGVEGVWNASESCCSQLGGRGILLSGWRTLCMDRSSSWGGSERAKGMAGVPVSKSQRGDRYANTSLRSPSPPPPSSKLRNCHSFGFQGETESAIELHGENRRASPQFNLVAY